MCEKFTKLWYFMSNYCTVLIGAYTDFVASDFLKIPSSEQTTPNPVPKGTRIKFLMKYCMNLNVFELAQNENLLFTGSIKAHLF